MSSLLYNVNASKAETIGQRAVFESVYRETRNAAYALQAAYDAQEMIEANDPDSWHSATTIDYSGARSHLWRD